METAWREISVIASRDAADAVSDKLIELGSHGTVLNDEKDNPKRCKISAYYPASHEIETILHQIERYLQILDENGVPVGKTEILTAVVENQDWNATWKQFFTPTRIGEHLVIKPSWELFSPEPGDIIVEIDPGMAFGTGLHPSTRLMLRLAERYLHAGNSVIDVGLGSGILTIAAAQLGASYVLGVDIDAEAVEIARENVAKNARLTPENARLDECIDIQVGSLDTLTATEKFDCLLMNIRPNIILPLFPYAAAYLQTGGAVLISGILEEEGPELVEQLRDFEFIVHDQLTEDGWIAYVLSHISNE